MALSDREGTVLAVNPAYCDLYGYDESEVVGRSFAVIFPPEFREQAEEEYRRYFTDAVDPRGVEAAVRHRDGEDRLVDVRYTFLEQDGERRAMVSVIRDVTERARAQRAERELMHAKDQLLLTISHDLRTPLTAIRGHAQLLLRRLHAVKGSDSRLTDSAEQIVQTASRMTDMIEALLDATRVRGDAIPLHRRQVDLVDVARHAIENQPDARDRERIVLKGPRPVVGLWDETRLLRVVDNLLSNALKYSPSYEPVIIAVSRQEAAGEVRAVLRVTDAGVGIPESEIDRIFDPFYRGTNVGVDVPGSGIGLAGVRQIVEMHDGCVSVASREGEGAVFTVYLPAGMRE